VERLYSREGWNGDGGTLEMDWGAGFGDREEDG